MIVGVGIDTCEVARMEEKVTHHKGFKEKVFSPAEIAFCEARKERGQHYAARFAAKEAFLKATGYGLTLGYDLADIEVISDEAGKPMLELKGVFREKAQAYNWNKIHLSLTHIASVASAVVIIEQ
jgi:holo-[acyl-carrier protein] synthase